MLCTVCASFCGFSTAGLTRCSYIIYIAVNKNVVLPADFKLKPGLDWDKKNRPMRPNMITHTYIL